MWLRLYERHKRLHLFRQTNVSKVSSMEQDITWWDLETFSYQTMCIWLE